MLFLCVHIVYSVYCVRNGPLTNRAANFFARANTRIHGHGKAQLRFALRTRSSKSPSLRKQLAENDPRSIWRA